MRCAVDAFGKSGAAKRSVAIAGATDLGLKLKEQLEEMPWKGYRFKGFYDDRDFEEGRRLNDSEAKPDGNFEELYSCLLYTSPSPRDGLLSRMPSSA